MERLHPNRGWGAIALRFLVVTGLAGCSNQQMSASNPFMAPDRVPPPATRAIAPGTAAPYYPGDPVPSAQNVPQPQPPAMVVQQASTSPPVATPPTAAAPQPREFTNERTVAIPSDDGKLRFALPSPPLVEQAQPMPPAAQQVAVAASAAQPPVQQAIPAAYNQPIAYQPDHAATPMPTATAENSSSGPWRAPQIPQSGSPVAQAQYVQPPPQYQPLGQPTRLVAQPQPQPALNVPAVPVELRAVPSPIATPTMTSAPPTITTPPPRMRFPSLTDPASWFSFTPTPPANQQLIGYMVPGPNGQMQMVPLEQFQRMQGTAAGTMQPPTPVASSDGFRPRGSVK